LIFITPYSFLITVLFMLFPSSIYYHHMLTLYMHEHLPLLFYTLTESLPNDPGFARLDIGCFIFFD